MRIAIIADAFPPMRTSAAVQLRDLAHELLRQGHSPSVLVPSAELKSAFLRENVNGVDLLRLRTPRFKDVGHVRRTVGEMLMPFAMLTNLRKSPLSAEKWDGLVWYSPTIFLGPLVRAIKKELGCPSYLILRDIFPEWAVDMGLMGRGLPYRFFKAVERYQYSVADTIGVQTPANLRYFDAWAINRHKRVEVLQNWLAEAPDVGCSISVAEGPLAGRTILVYAGNMGLAQGMDVVIEFAARIKGRRDIGFLFVGRGSEAQRLRDKAATMQLDNVAFYDEIAPEEIPGLYRQCHVGLVSLDPRHKTHNIPGKFLTYMQAGLPVLASVNPGNDLVTMIERERIGAAATDHSAATLERLGLALVDRIGTDAGIARRCHSLSQRMFSPSAIVRQITTALAPTPVTLPTRDSRGEPVFEDGTAELEAEEQ